MNLIAGYFQKKWAQSLGVIGALCVFVWFIGPRLVFPGFAPLRSQENRMIAIAVLLVLWLVYLLFLRWRNKKYNAQLLDAIADDSGDDNAQAEEAAALKSKMEEAVSILKGKDFSKSGGRKYIYELPWYIIIGPPGAGKTTLLTNSGLNFPLEESHGKYSIKGVGGTRNCDWWFTDKAVLLDTAGRYTTQDSNADIDKSAWETFLGLLKDNRKRRPVNGMIVALALHDIINSSEDDLVQMAKTIRFRISEIHEKFGMKPPVYLVVTKCDLLTGFSDYFASFDDEQRAQVWGFTLPPEASDQFTEKAPGELQLLKDTLYKQLTTKLEHESSQSRRDQIYGFPMQFAAMQRKLGIFVNQFASQSRLQDSIFIRGLYFTSATQDGSALDQVISSVSARFGFAGNLSKQNTGTGKSFFINRLLSDVIFGEAGLAGTDLAGERRAGRIQKAAFAGIALGAIALIGVWFLSHGRNVSMMKGV
ncbi:MAG: type VI secretion system membrane subunit TssM, partial [Pseudomonadota bacterium]